MQRIPRARTPIALAFAASAALASCTGGGGAPARTVADTPVIQAVSPTPIAQVTPPPLPAERPRRRGKPTKECVRGWRAPPERDPLAEAPLRILRRETGWRGRFVVADLRLFDGPESPPDPEVGYLRNVRRWYVKGYVAARPQLQGRFLVERRRFGSGVSAVAPYDSTGWRSPDWIGFQVDTADPAPKAYPGLPGRWSGIPYDFVRGGEGLDIPGLPAEVVGCLTGT